MLVIARKAGEAILLGDDIEVVVLGVQGSGDQAVIRLGIEAPRQVKITRKEVLIAVSEENRRAQLPSVDALGGLAQLLGQPEDKKTSQSE